MEHVAEHTRQGRAVSAVQMAGKNALCCSRLQPKLTVNTPGDAFEQQADAVAAKVMESRGAAAVMGGDARMEAGASRKAAAGGAAIGTAAAVQPALARVARSAAPVMMPKCASCEREEKLQRKETEKEPGAGLRQVEADLKQSQGEGRPLPVQTNTFMSRRIGADFSAVRIHTGIRAHAMNKAVKAQAFTYGRDIYFREGQYDPESSAGQYLLAHELTHVVQQGHAPPLTTEAAAGTTSKKTEATGGAIPKMAGGESIHRWSLAEGADYLSSLNPLDFHIEDLVQKFMPGVVVEIKQAGGILPWLEKKVTAGLDKLLNAAIGPVKDAVNFISNLSPAMAKIITWIQTAGVKISRNDCSSFTELGQMVEQFVDELTAPAIEKIKELASTASAWCNDLWQKFGVPVWDFIKKYIGDQWDMLKSLGNLIWEKSEPIRKWVASAWVKFKNWLGIGDGPEGQNGILQWVEGKITSVWDAIKAKIEPFKTQLMVIGGVLLLLSPAGPLIAAGAAFTLIISAVNWYRKNIHSPADIVKLRVKFEKEILPSIMQGINKATAFLRPLFGGLIDKFNSAAGAMGKLVGLAAGGILSFIQSALQWISDGFNRLVTWIGEGLNSLSGWLDGIFQKVRVFVIPIIQFLEKVSAVVNDILQLPVLIAGAIWKQVPACIRLAVEDFLLNTILKNVPFFEDIVSFIKYWQKIKAGVIDVVKTVFVKGDLKGAILKAFQLFLDVLGIPVDLVVGIYNKAVASWETIVNKPKILFGNIVQSIKNGFINFSKNFATNAVDALGNWVFSKVKGVKMPKEFTFQSVFGLILDILGFTEDNIFKRIEMKTSKKFADNLRKGYNALKSLAKWVIELFQDPKAAYEKLKKQASAMKNKLFASIGQWIAKSVIGVFIARIMAELATTPFGEAIEAIVDAYQMIRTATEYAERILRVVDGVLDSILELANGTLKKATDTVEKGLTLGLEVAVAFIAKVLGIGDVPVQVKKIVEEDIRPLVDKGIDVVIDEVIAVVQALKDAVGLGDKKEDGKKKAGEKGSDQTVEKPIDMNGNRHRLIMEIKGESPQLLIASSPVELRLICHNAYVNLNKSLYHKDEIAPIENKLLLFKEAAMNVEANVKLKVPNIRAKYPPEQHRDRIDYEVIATMAELHAEIVKFAKKYHIPELQYLIGKVPPARRIIKSPESLRECYEGVQGSWSGSSFRSSSQGEAVFMDKVKKAQGDAKEWKKLIEDYVVVASDDRKNFDFNQPLHVDHYVSLANHWSKGHQNEKGNDADDAVRYKFMNNASNLRVITAQANLKKAKEKDGFYAAVVGPNFNSILVVRGTMQIE